MFFMTKSLRKNVPDVVIELGAACMPCEFASDRATSPGKKAKGPISLCADITDVCSISNR